MSSICLYPLHFLKIYFCIFNGQLSLTAASPWVLSSHYLESLSNEISKIRQELTGLFNMVSDLAEQMREKAQDQPNSSAAASAHVRDARGSCVMMQSPASTHRGTVPKQPQFVGPTRSAFGLLVGEHSLNRMGIPSFDSLPPSGVQSPTEVPEGPRATDVEFWERCTADEFAKFLVVFQEEIESVYPFVEMSTYSGRSQEILDTIRHGGIRRHDVGHNELIVLRSTDFMITRVAVATGMVLEAHGKSDLSSAIVEPVERSVSSLFSTSVSIAEIQLLTMLVSSALRIFPDYTVCAADSVC